MGEQSSTAMSRSTMQEKRIVFYFQWKLKAERVGCERRTPWAIKKRSALRWL